MSAFGWHQGGMPAWPFVLDWSLVRIVQCRIVLMWTSSRTVFADSDTARSRPVLKDIVAADQLPDAGSKSHRLRLRPSKQKRGKLGPERLKRQCLCIELKVFTWLLHVFTVFEWSSSDNFGGILASLLVVPLLFLLVVVVAVVGGSHDRRCCHVVSSSLSRWASFWIFDPDSGKDLRTLYSFLPGGTFGFILKLSSAFFDANLSFVNVSINMIFPAAFWTATAWSLGVSPRMQSSGSPRLMQRGTLQMAKCRCRHPWCKECGEKPKEFSKAKQKQTRNVTIWYYMRKNK